MRTAVLALVILGSVARWTTAEINMADTIEWVTADSDVVIVGSVTQVTKRQAGAVVWYDTTIRPTETLKGSVGSPGASVQVAIRYVSGDTPEQWKTRKAELVVFLVGSKRRIADDKDYGKAPYALRASHGDAGVYDLGRPIAAYTAAFGLLTKRDELVAAVRAAARSNATKAHKLDAPFDSAAGKALWAGSTVWLYVPVDAALEQRAVAWLASKSINIREEAVSALTYFKSSDNVRRLESLLADPEFATVTDGTGRPTKRRYLVRARADEVLTKWGVAHKPPVIEAPL